MRKSRILVLLVAALAILLCGQSFAAPEKVSGEARRIIVVFRSGVGEPAYDQVLQRTGAVKVKTLRLINAAVVLAGPASERALRQQVEVLRVEEDAVVHALAKPQPAAPAESLPWGVDRIGADLVWDQNHDLQVDTGANAGAGVKVAVLDTGIDLDHPDLRANVKGGVNTINPRKSADDDNGHGTHVAGIVAAVDNAIGVLGVAPRAWLYAVKVLDRQGSGFVSDIIEGLQWCIDNGMQVVNMSFGTSSDVQSFHDAIVAAYNAGLVLVAAAGNSGPGDDTVLYPARYPEVIAVSATDKSDAVPYWSSRGPEVELAAPGVDVYSTYKGGGYATLSGTSMAAPHVTGVAALVIAGGISDGNGNGVVNDEVRSRLQSTAEDLGAVGRDNLYGYGLVDAGRAVAGP